MGKSAIFHAERALLGRVMTGFVALTLSCKMTEKYRLLFLPGQERIWPRKERRRREKNLDFALILWYYSLCCQYAGIAQSVEQLIRNHLYQKIPKNQLYN